MGGTDWENVAEPLKEVGIFFYVLFLLYIAIFEVVIMNTITSVFFEAMMTNSDKDQLAVIEMHMEKKEEYIDKLEQFYMNMDDDGDGEITYDEFMRHVDNDPHMLAFASALEIDLMDAKEFFRVLSNEETCGVDLETFVTGCIKLKGTARSMDLMDLIQSHHTGMQKQTEFFTSLHKKIDDHHAGVHERLEKVQPTATSLASLPRPSALAIVNPQQERAAVVQSKASGPIPLVAGDALQASNLSTQPSIEASLLIQTERAPALSL
jgi:hypothetical protein